MPAQQLFEYAVIRVVPRVEREEFINVGVILYCAGQKFLQSIYYLDIHKIQCLSPQTDMDELCMHLNMFESICSGSAQGGPIAALDAASRFRWLTATRSTVVQCSKVHPGFCTDAAETLAKLHNTLVL